MKKVSYFKFSLAEIVEIYNSVPKILLNNVNKVNIKRDNSSEQIILEEGKNGTYWIILTEDENDWLVPKGNLIINEFNQATIKSLFNFQKYDPSDSKEFTLLQPAKVSIMPNSKEWKLEKKGSLNFDPNLPSSKLRSQLKKTQEECEKLQSELEDIKKERQQLISQVARLASDSLQDIRANLVTRDEFNQKIKQQYNQLNQKFSQTIRHLDGQIDSRIDNKIKPIINNLKTGIEERLETKNQRYLSSVKEQNRTITPTRQTNQQQAYQTSVVSNIQLIVYEFSRKVLEPKKLQDKWVSTGFDKEIGFSTLSEVPPSIKNAVHNHWFRLNDNYPPAEREIALIAREIEQYAVLAVATRLADEAGRPLIGYRYFWLEKPPEIDGIGTLLKWWLDHDRPHFVLKPHQQIRQTQEENWEKGYYNINIVTTEQQKSFDDYRQQVEDIIPQIKHTPHIFTLQEKSKNSEIPDYLGLHFLALYLKKEYHKSIAWAWNVTLLENPNQFTLICCVDEEYCKSNLKFNTVQTPLEKSTKYFDKWYAFSTPQWVNNYNTNLNSLSRNFIEVSETEESLKNRRLGISQIVILAKKRRGNYWILTEGSYDYLVPSQNLRINQHNYKTVEALFECHHYHPDYSSDFQLLKPAVVYPLSGGQTWQLQEPGILQF